MRPLAAPFVPPIAASCRLTVVIPARNEAAQLGATLAAFGRQVDLAGQPLAHDVFDMIVFANNCRDGTAAVARRCAANWRLPLHVVEDDLPADRAHIGTARKYVMDLAARRFEFAGLPDGIIASTDSDTIVDARWVAATIREAAGVDAVAGHVTLADADAQRLLAPVRLLYARERAYRRLLAEVEAVIDPLPEDPLPRHSSFVGASFAVRARTYRFAGALPALPCLEDLHFSYALRRIDARIRHSLLVTATTSGREHARVAGGFGAFMTGLRESAARGRSHSVEHPRSTIAAFSRRAALRRLWLANHAPNGVSVHAAATLARSGDAAPLAAGGETFGRFHESIVERDAARAYPPVPVELAIAGLRAFLDRRQADALPDESSSYA